MLNTEKVPLFKNHSVCSKKICLYAKSAIRAAWDGENLSYKKTKTIDR